VIVTMHAVWLAIEILWDHFCFSRVFFDKGERKSIILSLKTNVFVYVCVCMLG